MAPSGEGKSTLIEGLAGLLEDKAARFGWVPDITQLTPHKRPLAVLFQEGNLFDHLRPLGTVPLWERKAQECASS